MKAETLEEIIKYCDPHKPLTPENKEEWDSFYTDTGRLDVEKIIAEFHSKYDTAGHKILFGGHSGNGKSTELNRLAPIIGDRFSVIQFDVKETLNPNDIEIVELLLVICLKVLEFADGKSLSISPYINKEFEKLEGFFHDTLKIETSDHEQVKKEIGLTTEAKAKTGFLMPFLQLSAKFYAKVSGQHETRELLRKEYRPRLTELTDLISDLITDIQGQLDKKPLIIVDGLDRIPVQSARRLFVEDGQNIAVIKNAFFILTIPISMIHSTDSSIIQNVIGNIRVLSNIRIKTRGSNEDEKTIKNIKIMEDFVYKRIEKALLPEEILKIAITNSGGVFRSLMEFLGSAAVNAKTYGGEIVDVESMEEAIQDAKIMKSRPLNRIHWDMLLEIDEHKEFLSKEDDAKLELLHGLFALEYINGSQWYDVNPLLEDGLKRYKKMKAKETGQ